MELQPRLFDALPPTREETPVHQLNYPTFAGAENTMWHGRGVPDRGWNPELGGGWNPQSESPAHVGTFEAAAHRTLGERARATMRDPGGGKIASSSTYRPRSDLMGSAGVGGVQMLPFRIRERSMYNDPDMPVSDAHANIAAGEDNGEYLDELAMAGVFDDETLGETSEEDLWEQGHYPDAIENTGGLYYRNAHEDPGSISAVVPSAKDLQHWPSEVMKNSTNPAQRRTAEFLLGRGY